MFIKSFLAAALLATIALAAPILESNDDVIEMTGRVVPVPTGLSTSPNTNVLEARSNAAFCDVGGTKGTTSEAKKCVPFLKSLGDKTCKWSTKKDGTGISMCDDDNTFVALGAIGHTGSISMKCLLAGQMAENIINKCANDGKVIGAQWVAPDKYTSTGFKPAADIAVVWIAEYTG